MFIKRYTSGTSVDQQQYLHGATVNTAGAIVGGTWSFQGTTVLTETWSATR